MEDRLVKEIDVVGIGNAIVDLLINTSESFLISKSLTKGSMKLISQSEADDLILPFKSFVKSSGGSAANTLSGIAELGGKTTFIGKVRNDNFGEIFTEEIKSSGTNFKTKFSSEGESTARCVIFVTPDAERTMCTHLGTSSLLKTEDIDFEDIIKAKILYLEGYLFDSSDAKNAFINAAQIANKHKTKVALSLSDSFCIDRHRSDFLSLITDNVDILFANEKEILSLFQVKMIEDAIIKAKEICDTLIITKGENGSVIINEEKQINIDPINLGNVIDTTGAGDYYAGGFIFGYLNNNSLEICGKMGSICAAHIITQMGSKNQSSLKDIVRNHI